MRRGRFSLFKLTPQNISLMLAAQNEAREKGWYAISNLADGEAEVFIYGLIGGSFFDDGVEALPLIKEMRAINAKKLLIRVNSPGGNVGEALAIRNAIREFGGDTETRIDGQAFSAAAWVGLTANKVSVTPQSRMMIHEPFDLFLGNPADMRKYADVLDGIGDDIANMLAAKGGGEASDWREKMRAETWFSDKESVNAGLADEIAGAPQTQKTFNASVLALYGEPRTQNKAPTADNPLIAALIEFERGKFERNQRLLSVA